jgi:hypothetical protein
MSFAASPRFRSSDRPNDVAILTIHPRRTKNETTATYVFKHGALTGKLNVKH